MTAVGMKWNIRLLVVCMAAVSVSLPIAWISLAKLFLALAFVGEVIRRVMQKSATTAFHSLSIAQLVPWVLVGAFLSVLWAQANLATALASVVKHSKLIFLLLPAYLLRDENEVRRALQWFCAGVLFLMASAWLLAAHVPLPWATHTGGRNAVFSTYLDQSMIMATSAAVFWHLRNVSWSRWFGTVCAASAAGNVFLLEGRTGYVLLVALGGLLLAWRCPPNWRMRAYGLAAALVLACVSLAYLYAQQNPDRHGPTDRAYKEADQELSSDQWRLNAWRRSLQAIEQRPLVGYGAGGWKAAIIPLEGARAQATLGDGAIGNPHQQFLLWGVEFGLPGMAALILIFLLLAREALRFDSDVARATWSVLAACAIAGMFNSVLYDDSIGDFYCIVIGLLIALGIHRPHNRFLTT